MRGRTAAAQCARKWVMRVLRLIKKELSQHLHVLPQHLKV